jgi:hypothetical protein
MSYCDELNTMKTKLTPTNQLRTVAAITATVAALGKATGNMYVYDYDTDAYYKTGELISRPTGPLVTDFQGIPDNIATIWMDLGKSGISNPDNYTYGMYPGIELENDPLEYICTDFTRDAVKYLQGLGHNIYSMALRMKYDDGTISDHEIILAIDNTRTYTYAIDPSSKIDRIEKTKLTTRDIKKIRTELMNPENWKPILKTTTKSNEQLYKEISTELTKTSPKRTTAPKTITLPEMTMLEPQDRSIYGTGIDLTKTPPKFDETYFEGAKITDVDIITSPGNEVFLGPGIKIESGDVNAVIPTDRKQFMMIQTTDNPKTLEELDKFGTIRTFNRLQEMKNGVK